MGCSRYNFGDPYSPGIENCPGFEYASEYYKALFRDKLPTIGQVFSAHKEAMAPFCDGERYRWIQYSMNLLGDPAMTAYISQGGPPQVKNPLPANGETGVEITAQLSWDPSNGADHYRVYFGTSKPPFFAADITECIYSPTLEHDTTYYWHVNPVDEYGNQTWGVAWAFSTKAASGTGSLPAQAANPDPADLALGVNLVSSVSWSVSENANSYDVYFGASDPPSFLSSSVTASAAVSGLQYETTYYWRVDAKNANGTTTGDVWRFTTKSGSAPPILLKKPKSGGVCGSIGKADLSSNDYFGFVAPWFLFAVLLIVFRTCGYRAYRGKAMFFNGRRPVRQPLFQPVADALFICQRL